jgi:putative SOS response-associated peptidase YedK
MTSIAEIAAQFGVAEPSAIELPPETIEGGRGIVILEKDGRRLLKGMTWGFPRLTREMRERGDPPGRTGMVADLTNPMWQSLVADPRYRCLIPITHFANPDGDPGEKTRTWFSVKDQPIMAWAGFVRNTPEFGPVYAGMTMDANAAVMPTNDRMPVLLEPDEYDRWLHGSVQDVIYFQYRAPVAAERMVVLPTEDRWRSGKQPAPQPQLALL